MHYLCALLFAFGVRLGCRYNSGSLMELSVKEIILINVAGDDKPGLTSSVTEILASYDVNILDIGQAVIHDTLSLGILVEVPETAESSPVLKDILFRTHELGLTVRFSPIEEPSYEQWVGGQGKPRYIVTLLARMITAEHISAVTSVVSNNKLNIDRIDRLSGRVPLAGVQQQIGH